MLPKLFWPTVRKNCSSDREKLLKFMAEGREFPKIFEITWKIYSKSERSEQFLVLQNAFITCSWMFLISNELEQLEFKLGFRNMQEKLENNNCLPRWSLSTFLGGKMLIVGMMIPLLVDCLICLQICSNIASTVVIWRQSSIWRVLQTCLPGHLHTGRLCLQKFPLLSHYATKMPSN